MLIAIHVPDPGTMREDRVSYVTVSAGTRLHRIHPSIFTSTAFNPTDAGSARFSPIFDSGVVIPTLYAAESFECAVCERILRCPDVAVSPGPGSGLVIVAPEDFAHLSYSEITASADLRLVDLTNAGQRRIGVNHNALVAGPQDSYPITRAWAEKIYRSCPDAQGIYYTSLQFGPKFAVVLFGDRVPARGLGCQSARKTDPLSASKIDPPKLRRDQGLSRRN